MAGAPDFGPTTGPPDFLPNASFVHGAVDEHLPIGVAGHALPCGDETGSHVSEIVFDGAGVRGRKAPIAPYRHTAVTRSTPDTLSIGAATKAGAIAMRSSKAGRFGS
jgi:hypothetical protein